MKPFAVCLALCASLFAQSSTPTSYPTSLFGSYLTMEAQTVATSPAVITTRSLIFLGGWISCTGAQTITLTDGNAVNILPAVAVAANQIVSLNVMAGAYVSGGFSISASGTGCKYSAWWRQ